MSSDHIDTDINSKYTPVTPDGTHIEWDDNDASLPGILDAVDKYCIENNYFQDFFQHRVVPLSKGMIAVDDIMVLKFRTGVHSHTAHSAQLGLGVIHSWMALWWPVLGVALALISSASSVTESWQALRAQCQPSV